MVSKKLLQRIEPLLFPVKLYELAHSKEIQSIKWSPDGAAVQLDVGNIRKELLETKIFNVKDYRHIFRQLSYYGFQRTQKLDKICEFFHPLFNAQRLDLVLKLKRSGKKNRNVDILSLAPFIERRTSSRLQSITKCNRKPPSASKSAEINSDSESSDYYPSTVAVKRRRRRVNPKTRVKKLRTVANESDESEYIPNHVGTTKQNTLRNGNQNPTSSFEEISVNRAIDENENKIRLSRKNRRRFSKKCPSRHATRDINMIPKREVVPFKTVSEHNYLPFNAMSKERDMHSEPSYSLYSRENDVDLTSKENSKISPLKINIKSLTVNSSYSMSVINNSEIRRSGFLNNKQSSICSDKLPCVQNINAGNTDMYVTSRTSSPKYAEPSQMKLEKDSNTSLNQTRHDTRDVRDPISANSSCNENSDLKFRIVPNWSGKKFVLGKSYKWMSVKKEIDSPVEVVNTTENISSTSQNLSTLNDFDTYNQKMETISCRSQAQVVPDQSDHVPTQSKISVRSSRCHASKRKRICNNGNTPVESESYIINDSSTHIVENNSFYSNSCESMTKEIGQEMVASSYNYSSSKLETIQTNDIAVHGNYISEEINDESTDLCTFSGLNIQSSIEFRKSDSFSTISQASGGRPRCSSSTERDCYETLQTNGESYNLNHAITPNSTLPNKVEEEIDISPHQKEELVQRLYLQFKMGEIYSWDLLESPNPLIKFVAYDVLTLDVEKAHGN